jgi:hypothetical protein
VVHRETERCSFGRACGVASTEAELARGTIGVF